MNPQKHSNEDLRALRCSLRREQIRFRRLKGRYLELKKSNPDLRIDFFEGIGSPQWPDVATTRSIPDDQVLVDLLEDLTRIMADLLSFMNRYDAVRKERPDIKISFIESIKNQYVIMN